MASIHRDDRTGIWLVMFRWGGAQFRRSCETRSEKEARDICARVEGTIRLLKQGRISIPDDADPGTWIATDGKVSVKPRVTVDRFGDICDDYLADQHDKAETTLDGERKHIRHLKKGIGEKTAINTIDLKKVQAYAASRPVSGATIRKELVTFSQVWGWARVRGIVKKECPIYDARRKWAVKFDKPAEREKFMTWAEIERRIARGGDESLWEVLFLDEKQVRDLLKYVKKNAKHDFIYPMFVFAAYTGARRSEILRSEIEDFDFDAGLVRLREKKRRKNMSGSFRTVPMHETLRTVMEEWLAVHPGGVWTIQAPLVMPKRTPRKEFTQMGPYEANHHFQHTLEDSKWEKIHGFHTLRHSFGSNLARKGVPRDTIGGWMGHSTQQMMDLYQHLFPQDWGAQISALD